MLHSNSEFVAIKLHGIEWPLTLSTKCIFLISITHNQINLHKGISQEQTKYRHQQHSVFLFSVFLRKQNKEVIINRLIQTTI